MTFVVRTEGNPYAVVSGVRAGIAALDSELPLFDVATMQGRIETHLSPRRTPTWIALGFAVLALFLSAVGIHGVLAYQVTLRTREFGIRIALGSTAGQLLGRVLWDVASVLTVGLVLGVVGAFALRSTVARQLYDVEPMDPMVLAFVVVAVSATALLASVVPSRRAMLVDPATVLRSE